MDKENTTERTAKVAKTETTAVSATKLGGTETIKNVATHIEHKPILDVQFKFFKTGQCHFNSS
jgi:hypothetical protein